ncbi:MAG: PocR ligand-binding domain-containing protein [Methanolobus sp.]
MEYGFTDIVDIFELQELVKVFDLTTSLSFTIKDHKGCEITSNKANNKFPALRCREFNDGKCGRRTESIWFTGDKKRSCYEYRCNKGQLKIEVPVFLENKQLATAVFDNFFVETNEQHIRLKPVNCEFSPMQSKYHIKSDIPVLSREDIRKKIDSFCVLIDLLISRGIRDLQIKKYESLFNASENGTIPSLKDNNVLDNKDMSADVIVQS